MWTFRCTNLGGISANGGISYDPDLHKSTHYPDRETIFKWLWQKGSISHLPEIGKSWEALECGQSYIDKTQYLQFLKLLCQANNAGTLAVIQVELCDLWEEIVNWENTELHKCYNSYLKLNWKYAFTWTNSNHISIHFANVLDIVKL